MNDEAKKQVESLIKKADGAANGTDALHYSQAALNCANAMCALANAGNITNK